MSKVVTCEAPVNMAVIKYWGKRDENLILPINSSISLTLNCRDLRTVTSVTGSKDFASDRMWLNDKEESVETKRIQNCLKTLRAKAAKQNPELANLKLHIVSRNNFPTAAGLASSAAGFACLVFSVARFLGFKEDYAGELSSIARVGSGSACRSLDGGFVKWQMGDKDDGSDSFAVQVANEKHWSNIQVLVCVVSDQKKGTSSTAGMQNSVRTSELLAHRAEKIVPGRISEMEDAIHKKDFQKFASLTIRDSNQFHATCMDTTPPIFYMNDVSKSVVALIEALNDDEGKLKAAYTFDAGPNAVIFTETEKDMKDVLAHILYYFPSEAKE